MHTYVERKAESQGARSQNGQVGQKVRLAGKDTRVPRARYGVCAWEPGFHPSIAERKNKQANKQKMAKKMMVGPGVSLKVQYGPGRPPKAAKITCDVHFGLTTEPMGDL